MWLIDFDTLQLEEFIDVDLAPPYAILSHTWGKEEVSFQEFTQTPLSDATRSKAGYRKIKKFCATAAKWSRWCEGEPPRVNYGWVDTCCIDKKSSAELSEAINSMYGWYMKAVYCLAYLADFILPGSQGFQGLHADWQQQFRKCRWFTRGWTLQELLAPEELTFFDHDWNPIGSKDDLRHQISEATNIEIEYLNSPAHASVATRMSWASRRSTTRIEDIAYCLMGLFQVNMPLLYGEGPKAFLRLQQEIIRSSFDESIFAWAKVSDDKHSVGIFDSVGIFATSPAAFRTSANMKNNYHVVNRPSPFTITSYGLRMDIECRQSNNLLMLRLSCEYWRTLLGPPLWVKLVLRQATDKQYVRIRHDTIEYWSDDDDKWGTLVKKRIYVILHESLVMGHNTR
ncbi:MAG: hypothetical protein LQ350_006687 [Teloschistes chrysophthalmus]|nr:MAG: hypothetical protein LQ350_006687 [Niorma chrysophthalma]